MLGRDRDGLAQSERIALENARLAGAAFGLVGGKHHGHVLPAQPATDLLVERGDAGARVDHKQRCVGVLQRDLGLRAHPAGQAVRLLVLPPGGVDRLELEAGKPGLAEAPVTRHPRLVVDQRDALADQPVEQRRLADVGAPDDDDLGEGFGHVRARGGNGDGWQVVPPETGRGRNYQLPVFSMLAHGSCGSRWPSCSSSIEIPSGVRTNAMWPSRGGRLIVTPASISRWQVA